MDHEAVAMTHEAIHEHLSRVLEPKLIHMLIERTDQHHTPEAVDGPARLAVREEPVEKRRIVVRVGAHQSASIPQATRSFSAGVR